MSILSIEEAKDVLRVSDDYLNTQISALLDAIPEYLKITTGKTWDSEPIQPLAKQAASFILINWFDGTDAYDDMIQKLLSALSIMGRNVNNE